jgi:hypothetical protein
MRGFISPRLGIRVEPGTGPDNLQIVGPHGEPFQTHAQEVEQRQAAIKLLEEERQLKEAERHRAERYAAKLRELSYQPD